ncbi:MAG: hypothetical protein OEV93_01200 [Candidatus Moranbacteria bacterium]|nr:hypothetical protein [Candidatus Moranbacteria bacterium]
MQFKIPKNTEKYYWTKHSIIKMRQYGLSGQRVTRVIRAPKRTESGIVKSTVAVMQPVSTRRNEKGELTWKSEIWVMYKLSRRSKVESQKRLESLGIQNLNPNFLNLANSKQIKIISAWKYPGVSPKNNPIPDEILEEIESIE